VKYRGRPVLAAICGFLLGVFLSLDLVLFGIVQLDNVIVTLLPIIGLVVGIVLALWAPFGRSRAAGPTAVSQ
jgi:hypothetical protein